MDQAQFYRFEDIQGDDMKAVEAYDPGGGAPNTTPKNCRLREDLPPVTQSFTRMDQATEKMVSPKFMIASDLGAMYPIRYYSAFKKNGYLAQPMDRDGMYHDDNANYRAHKEDIASVYKLDMQNGLYKNNVIYKPKDAKYAYVNINLLATNIFTRLSQYWEIKGHNFNYEFYNNPSPKNPYGASPQALFGIDALNFCAQYWEDVKLPDGRTKRITNWRIPTRAEMELIGAIQFNQRDKELPKGSYDNLLQKYKDENIFIWLIARSWFHNNGYIIFQPEYKNDNANINFCANPYGISYDFAYPGSFTYTDWLGYYTLFVRCVHDIDRYEKE